MNNEPVAWMSPDGKVSDTEGKLFYIPLYTHPPAQQWTIDVKVKELTDEDIAQEWSKFYPDVFHTHLIDFARAILRKAQEK